MYKLFISFALLISCCVSGVGFAAASLSLYEAPNATSKVITTLDAGEQLIPVFHPEKSEWIKVANPKNGDVGWVKVDDLKGGVNISGVSIRQQVVVDKDNKPQGYRIIEYTGSKQLQPEAVDDLIKQVQRQGMEMQKNMLKMQESTQQMMMDITKNINFDNDFTTFPIIQPVIVVPEQQAKDGQDRGKGKSTGKESDGIGR